MTHAAAETWRAETATRLRAEQFASLCANAINITDADRRFIAGFLDGDGCITVNTASITVGFAQSQAVGLPRVLTWIQSLYGGMMYTHTLVAGKRRTKHELCLFGIAAYHILTDLVRFCILKREQAALALQIVRDGGDDTRATSVRVADLRQRFNAVHGIDYYQQKDLDTTRINDEYISGLFDAEGCIEATYETSMFSINLAQQNCPRLLTAIDVHLGVNQRAPREYSAASIERGVLGYAGNRALEVLQRIASPLKTKFGQAERAFEFRRLQKQRPRTAEIIVKMQRLTAEIKALKKQ